MVYRRLSHRSSYIRHSLLQIVQSCTSCSYNLLVYSVDVVGSNILINGSVGKRRASTRLVTTHESGAEGSIYPSATLVLVVFFSTIRPPSVSMLDISAAVKHEVYQFHIPTHRENRFRCFCCFSGSCSVLCTFMNGART